MNKVKIIISYLLGFITTILIVILSFLVILKVTICDKEFVKEKINTNSSEVISNKIIDDMKNYMVSSGLPENILEDIFSVEDIDNEINKYVDNLYLGEKSEVDSTKVRENLVNNIDKYITDHDVKITSQSYLESFVNEMVKIYEKEVNHYGALNMLTNPFYKVVNIVNDWVIRIGIMTVLLLLIIMLLKVSSIGSVIMASGLIMLFIRYVIYYKIDVTNIGIISKEFSDIMRSIWYSIYDKMYDFSIGLIIIGFIIILSVFLSRNALKKQS